MPLIESFGLFLTSEWIWAMTFARSYIPINMICLLIMLATVGKAGFVCAILYSFFANIFSLVSFTLLVHGLIDKMLGIEFPAMQEAAILPSFTATFLLGIIYLFFHWLFFYTLSYFYSLPINRYMIAALLSNFITIFLIYKAS